MAKSRTLWSYLSPTTIKCVYVKRERDVKQGNNERRCNGAASGQRVASAAVGGSTAEGAAHAVDTCEKKYVCVCVCGHWL